MQGFICYAQMKIWQRLLPLFLLSVSGWQEQERRSRSANHLFLTLLATYAIDFA